MKKSVKKFQQPREFRFVAYHTPPCENTGFLQYQNNPNFNTTEQWKLLVDCGFNYAQPICYDRTEEHVERSIQSGGTVGVKVFVQNADTHPYGLANLIAKGGTYEEAWARFEQYKDEIMAHYNKFDCYDSFAGIFGSDEPNSTLFPAIKAGKDWFARYYPEREYFVNLLPNYAQGWQLFGEMEGRDGYKTYEDYVARFCETVQPYALSYDHYALIEGNKDRKGFILYDFFYNLAVVAHYARKMSKETGVYVPAYVYIQSMGFEGKRNLEDYEMWAWQCYTSLAYGFHGLQAFCYFSMLKPLDEGGNVISDALVDRNGVKTATYDYVQRALKDIKAIENVYLSYDWEGTKAVYNTDPYGLFKPLKNWNLETLKDVDKICTDGDFLIGQFESCENTDKKAYMVTNASDPYPENRIPSAKIVLHFNGVNTVMVYKPGQTAERVLLQDGVLEMQVPCGQGYFIETE